MNYEVYQDDTGEYRWRLKLDNGEVVAFSREEAFDSTAEAHAGVQEFKSLCSALEPQSFIDAGDEYRWRLKSSAGQTEAVSAQSFESRDHAHSAAEDVRDRGVGVRSGERFLARLAVTNAPRRSA
jgi:uncharacterized protein YegP (UPF0339 family)